MKRLLFLILVVAIGALVVGVFARGTYVAPAQTTAPATIAVATSTISETTDAYTIDAQYPQFGIPTIDTQIKAIYDDAVSDLTSQPTVPHGMSVAQNSFTGRFDRVYIGPNIISAELILSSYTGGAHPGTVFAGVAFDRSTGKRLVLNDALGLIGMSLEEVASSSLQQLSTTIDPHADLFAEGAAPIGDNYQWFTVSSSTVTFIFQQYQVAAYAYGPQYVSFPRVR